MNWNGMNRMSEIDVLLSHSIRLSIIKWITWISISLQVIDWLIWINTSSFQLSAGIFTQNLFNLLLTLQKGIFEILSSHVGILANPFELFLIHLRRGFPFQEASGCPAAHLDCLSCWESSWNWAVEWHLGAGWALRDSRDASSSMTYGKWWPHYLSSSGWH